MIPPLPRWLFSSLLVLAVVLGVPTRVQSQPAVTVFAAASLKTALDEVAELYSGTGGAVQISYGGSSTLARQIQYGAPAQVFISANADWMDFLEKQELLVPGTRRNLLTNRLVLIAGSQFQASLPIQPGFDLSGELGQDHLAMALVDAVPAGQYGRAALQYLGVWEDVQSRIAQTDNVRAALKLVAMGEAPFGIVYATDARAEPRVRVLGTFPADSHPPILYPVAVVDGPNPEPALAFLSFLASPPVGEVFLRHGFGLAENGT